MRQLRSVSSSLSSIKSVIIKAKVIGMMCVLYNFTPETMTIVY
jgi:hypothetical protein